MQYELISHFTMFNAEVYRRSDLEILAYCAIHWLSGSLPWIGLITDPDKVQQSKIK